MPRLSDLCVQEVHPTYVKSFKRFRQHLSDRDGRNGFCRYSHHFSNGNHCSGDNNYIHYNHNYYHCCNDNRHINNCKKDYYNH